MLLKTRCIPVTPNGSDLKLITDIIHPSGFAAKLYTPDDGYFPHGEIFTGKNILTYLEKLGMKVDDISWDDIMERAKSVQKLDEIETLNTRYRNVMASIQRKLDHPSKKDGKKIAEAKEVLQAVPFWSFAEKPKYFPIAWSGDNLNPTDRFCSSDLYAWEDRYLVSVSSAVADESDIPLKTKTFFNLGKKAVTVQQVTTQLEHIMKVDVCHTCSGSKEYDELQRAITRIYTYIQHKIKDGDEMAEQLCEMMHDRKCVLVKNMFCAPKELAQNFPHDCTPYMFELPQGILRHFKPLVAKLRISEEYETVDYVRVLQIMHSESNGQKLNARQLHIANTVTILLNAMLKKKKLQVHEVVDSFGEIYIPNAKAILQPSRTLCYNDCPWITDTRVMNFTHTALGYGNSDCLGVKTKRQDALNKHAKGIPFGQKDRLTNSVKRILKKYPCNHEILKELIQNADDAGATEIHFICDFRSHSEKYLFDNTWKRLQGPALCVYNNRPFTADEMEGIQLLDDGSNSSDPSRTGQYGVSFSSMYHLTDVPSVLTDSADDGRSLCVFDPSCSFVPGATEMEPCVKYENVDVLENIFPDVFTCYLPKQINIKGGTMMRFPLRTEAMAKSSKISNQDISMSRVRGMLEELKNEAFDILIFLIYLEEIKISEIDVMTGQVTNTYTVKTVLSDETRHTRLQMAHDMKAFGQRVNQNLPFITRAHHQFQYTLCITDNKGREETWCIARNIGFKQNTDIPANIRNAIRERNLTLRPQGGAACLLKKRLHDSPENTHRKMKVFCTQPLGIDINFPVHVNGQFALMDETRRHLWSKEPRNDYRNEWNNLLCTTVIADAYVNLLKAIRLHILASHEITNEIFVCQYSENILKERIETFFRQFPMGDRGDSEWGPLLRSVYQTIARDKAPVLPVIQRKQNSVGGASFPGAHCCVRWVSPANDSESNAFFSQTEPITLKDILRDCGMNLIEIPQKIVEVFINSDVKVEYVSPGGVLSFLKSRPVMKHFSKLPCKLYKTPFLEDDKVFVILRYCLQEKTFLQNLDGVPLLLTEDSVLRVFDKNKPVFASEYADIAKERSDLFLKVTCLKEIFPRTNIDSCCFFKKLTASDIAEILSNNQFIKRVDSGSNQPVTWQTGDSPGLSRRWLNRLWTLLEELTSPQAYIKRDTTKVIKMLSGLEDWCLIPAKHEENYVLYSLSNANNVICFEDRAIRWEPVCSILKELCIAELDMATVRSANSSRSELAKAVVTTLEKPRAILDLLHTKFQQSPDLRTPCLTTRQAETLLAYFAHHIHQLNNDDKGVNLLRDLPIYTTICGDMIPLTNCAVYTLPSDIPTKGIDIWQSRAGMVFLKRNEEYADLYQMLGFASISVVDVYCKFIFQHLEYFLEDDRMIHLHHVYHSYIKDDASRGQGVSHDEARCLQETLQNLPIIPDQSGDLQPASKFYDPTHKVFRAMLAEDCFPQQPKTHIFNECEWYTFLGKVGLIMEMKKDMLINFANQVAAQSHTQDEDAVLAKSRVLVEHLFNMPAHARKDIMSDICKVQFVVQVQISPHLTNVLPQYGHTDPGRLSLISFRDGVRKEFLQIAWTQMGVLPTWADPLTLHHLTRDDKAQILETLQMKEKPGIDIVMCHLLTLTHHIESSGPKFSFDVRNTIKDVYKEIYRFLADNIEEDHDIADKLSGQSVALVGDGTCVVKPCQTVVNFTERDEIKPWLFKFPTYLGEFAALFERLGATPTVSVNQYINVLERIRENKGVEKLNPNERLKVLKAMRGVLDGLCTSNIRKGSVSTLYLPTETGNMLDASKLVFNDVPSFYDRVQKFGIPFLLDPRECGADHQRAEEVMMNLPAHMRPRLLSAIVREILDEDCKETKKTEGLSNTLGHRVKSQIFHSAVSRLVRHNAQKTGQKIDAFHVERNLEMLSTVNVYGVDDVITYLTYKDKPIEDSQTNKVCFAEKIQDRTNVTCHWDMYIQNNGTPSNTLLLLLAEFLNKILSGLLGESVLYLIPILSCPERDIISQLDSMNIRVDQMQQDDRRSFLPILGTQVNDFVAQIRCQEAEFEVGEFVGCQRGSDAPILHARVEEIITSHGNKLSYLLNIGPDQKLFSTDASQMHKYQ